MEIPKIDIPKDRTPCNVFADCETFLWTDGKPVWEMKDEEGFGAYLAATCEVVPWLFGALMPSIEVHNNRAVVNLLKYVSYESCEFPHKYFFDCLKRYWDAGYTPVIWFHNASYDLTACIETMFKELDPDLVIYFTAKDSTKGFLRGAMESPKFGFKARFGDTLLYRRISLAEIGEMFPETGGKGEIPYTMADLYIQKGTVYFTDWLTGKIENIPYERCRAYVRKDVELLKCYFDQLEKDKELITVAINQGEYEKVRATTQGVHARSLLDLWLNKHHNGRFESIFKFPVSPEEGRLMQRSLTGGFTSVNKTCFSYICDDTELITSFDCNSMYPKIMTMGIPCGYLMDRPPLEDDYVEWVCIAAKDIVWKGCMECVATPPIPETRQTHNFTMPTKIYVMRNFLDFVRENTTGEIVEYYSRYQKITHTPGAFVNYLYDLRKTLRDQWEDMERELEDDVTWNRVTPEEARIREGHIKNVQQQEKGVKTTLNSLYGKLAEKAYLSNSVYMDGKFNTVVDEKATFKCVLSGAYIALTGRLMIYTFIKKVIEAGFKFLYADTDGVKFAFPKSRERELEDIFGFNTGELGQWKNEGYWNEFHTPGKKKKYCAIDYVNPSNTLIKLSGISEHIYVFALRNGLNENPEKTIRDLRYIFNANSNVLFIGAKNKSVRSDKYDQIIIHPINVMSNAILGDPTAECNVEPDGRGRYTLKIYGKEAGK